MVVRAPVITEESINVDYFAPLSVRCPNGMAALHSDLSVDLGYWRDIPIHAHPPVSVHIGVIRDILALCWYPGVIIFLL